MRDSAPELTVVFDPDLATLLVYGGQPVIRATDEGDKIGLWFPTAAVADKQADLASGRALVEPCRWSATVRRLHAEYLSRSARESIRARGRSFHA